MFDKDVTKIEFANQAAYQFIIAQRPDALQFGRPDDVRSSESSEGYDHSHGRLKDEDLQKIYDSIRDLKLKRVQYDNKLGVKIKVEVGFIEMIKSLRNRELQQAKLPDPFNKIVDIQRYEIRNRNQLFVIIKDFSVIREREKAMIQNQLQTVFFASVAHDLRTPLNSLLASNTSLTMMFKEDPDISNSLSLQRSSILFLMSLVEDILDLSKIQISKFDLTQSWFSFHELVSETLEMCAY